VYALLTGNLTRAAAAQRLLNIQMALNPIGAVAAAVLAAGTAIALYSRRLTGAEYAQKALNEAEKDAERSTRAQTSAIERLTGVIRDESRTRNEKLAAVKQLRDIMPGVLDQYTDEEVLAGKATKAIQAQTKAIILQAKIRARQEKIQELEAKRLAEESGDRDFWSWDNFRIGAARTFGGAAFAGTEAAKITVNNINNIDKAISALTEGILDAQGELNTLYGAGSPTTNPNGADPVVPGPSPTGPVKKTDAEKKAERDRKAYEQMIADQRAYQQEVLFNSKSLREQEDIEFRNRLEKAGLYDTWLLVQQAKTSGEAIKLSRQQAQVLEALELEHQTKLERIDAQAIDEQLKQKEEAFKEQLTLLRIRNNEEYLQADTLEKAKLALSRTMSSEQLSQIKTFEAARKALQAQHQNEERKLSADHARELLDIIQNIINTGEFEGLDLANKVLSEEQKEALLKRLNVTKEQLQEILKLIGTSQAPEDATTPDNKVDIFGMTARDWELLYENLEKGKVGVQEIMSLWGAASQLWDSYNNLVTAGEQRELQRYEEANNKKKESLERRLEAGTISQENYNSQVNKLDRELAQKRAKLEHDQAKREKSLAIAKAIMNTAQAVTAALTAGPIVGAILAAAVAAMGAIQVATIARQPIPSLTGLEGGGYLVRRSQDGKVFDTDIDPDRRGYVGRPTVIVGENGNEFVASAQAVENPSVKPVLDIIDTAQRNGTISTLNLEKIMSSRRAIRESIPGRASGGTVSGASVSISGGATQNDEELRDLLRKNTEVMQGLRSEIQKGIKAEVALLGRNGFYEKDAEFKRIQNDANL